MTVSVAGITPTSLGAEAANGTVKISSVMDLAFETYRQIYGLNEFRIVGIDLMVPDGEGFVGTASARFSLKFYQGG